MKYAVGKMIHFRWIERSQIPMQLLLTFRYRGELSQFYFAVTVGRRDTEHVSKEQKYSFSEIEKFEISCKSLRLGTADTICVYAKPKKGENSWIYIGDANQHANADANQLVKPRSLLPINERSHRMLCWMRAYANKIQDKGGVLVRFGLQREQCSEWIPKILDHPLLFAITAHRSRLCIERLVVDLELVSTEMVFHIIGKWWDGKEMLLWLVENRKVKLLYDHYRAFSSGWKSDFRSHLLKRTWMKFERNVQMNDIDEFKGADDSILNKTVYLLGDDVYPIDTQMTSICVEGIPHQRCCNVDLFGDHDIHLDSHAAQTVKGQVKPISSVVIVAPENHATWFQRTIEVDKIQALQLAVSKHRGHYGSRHPDNLLQRGRETWYDNDEKGPVTEDWIVFKMLSVDAIPTGISILNGNGRSGLKRMKILGSVDNEVFEEWISIPHLVREQDSPQHFELDSMTVHFAWNRGFRFFRLCSMDNFGSNYLLFYEFTMYGICSDAEQREHEEEETAKFQDFVEALNIDENSNISVAVIPDTDLKATKFEIKVDEKWVEGVVSRETAEKVCVKWNNADIIYYRWIPRDQIPMNIRFKMEHQNQISQHIFSVSAGTDGAAALFPQSIEFMFDVNEDFIIPLSRVIACCTRPDTVSIYAKPNKGKHDFDLIKRIQCDQQAYSRFNTRDSFRIDKEMRIDVNDKCEVITKSDITITKTGSINMMHGAIINSNKNSAILNYGKYIGDIKERGGMIFFISGGDMMNEGTISCTASEDASDEGAGTVYIDVDGVFENKGIIDCGQNGVVHIRCSEFKNDGQIIPIPKVTYKDNTDRMGIKQLTSNDTPKRVTLEVSSHRGHYGSKHPKKLLIEGAGDHYDSDGKGPPAEDWIVFCFESNKLIFPTSIVLRNYKGSYGLKTIKIEASSDGIRFDEWVDIKNVSNDHHELQAFTVDTLTGYFAWERAFRFFKVNVIENHGASYNMFYEFGINGIDQE